MYDLHSHSLCSDGVLSPRELVARAKEYGVTALALTDHDTLAGQAEAHAAANDLGILAISGIELSCQWSGVGVHIVGLNFDLQSPIITDAVAHQQHVRRERAEVIANKLAKLGMQGALEGAQRFAGDGSVGRPHFAKWLIENNHVPTMSAAFKRYLGAGKPGDVKQMWPTIGEAVSWISSSGGLAVLAHPDKYKLTRTKLNRLLLDFVEVGGRAMEVVSGKQTASVTQYMAHIADKHQLYASCGSDFHVPEQAWQELGQFGSLPSQCQPIWGLWQEVL